MDENKLLRVAMVISLIGVFGLIIASENQNFRSISLANLDEFEGKLVEVEGYVKSVTNTPSLSIITLEDGESVRKAIFEGNVSLFKGDFVIVSGNVLDYNGEMEISAEKIRVE